MADTFLLGSAAGASIGATIAAVAVKAETGVHVTLAVGNAVLYEGATTVTALATGALAGGVIAGAVVLYLYRNEIADWFEARLNELHSLVQSLFGENKNVSKVMTEMVDDHMKIERTILDDATRGSEEILAAAKNISPSDKETVRSAMGGTFRILREVNSTFKDKVQPVAKKYGIDARPMFERSEKLIDFLEQKWEQIAKDL